MPIERLEHASDLLEDVLRTEPEIRNGSEGYFISKQLVKSIHAELELGEGYRRRFQALASGDYDY